MITWFVSTSLSSSVMALSSSSYLSVFSSTLFSTLFPSSTPPPPLSLRVPQASTYNVQIIVGEDEPEDKVVNRFRRVVLKAGVLQECRRRRFFENKQDKAKRKSRDASRRNRKRYNAYVSFFLSFFVVIINHYYY